MITTSALPVIGLLVTVSALFAVLLHYRHRIQQLEQRPAAKTTPTQPTGSDRVGELVKLAGHDLRSPLRSIRSLVGFLQEDLEPDIDEQSRYHLTKIESRVDRMDRLLESLLRYSRAGDGPAEAATINPADLVEEALNSVETQGCLVVAEPVHSGPTTLTAEAFLACLVTMIDNACKHHDGDGGLVTVSVVRDGDELVATVADDGPGIDPQFHHRIFEPLFTLRSQDEVEGSGMGLPILQRLTESNGGQVSLESNPGDGSTFTVRWPVSDRAGVGTPQRTPVDKPATA